MALPKELVDKLRYVEVSTTRAVRDHRAGEYRSPWRGRGFEFDQHKPYQQGDDYRQIDWNVTARMQFPYVKREFEEKELNALLMVDLSRSMDFSSGLATKRELLVEVAAILTFSCAADNMNIGLLAFTDRVEAYRAPKRGLPQAWRLLEFLWELEPAGSETRFACGLEWVLTRLKHTTLIFCISDFISADQVLDSPYLKVVAHRHDFVPVIVEDFWDEELPEAHGYLRLRDVELGQERVLTLSPGRCRVYRRLMSERKEQMRRSFYRLNLDHLYLRTGRSYLKEIMTFFAARKRRR